MTRSTIGLGRPPLTVTLALALTWFAGCGDTGVTDASVPLDLTANLDLAAVLDQASQSPADLLLVDATLTPDACVPNVGPGCCYPKCMPGEELACLGANVCGYPCSCVASLPDITATVQSVQAWQNCMPSVPPDPIAFSADFILKNVARADSPLIKIGGGAIVDGGSKRIASFALDPLIDVVVPGGGTVKVHVVKAAGSVQPASGCNTVPCKAVVSWRIEWGPAGAPPSRSTASEESAMVCAF